jgi:hypothetical protein
MNLYKSSNEGFIVGILKDDKNDKEKINIKYKNITPNITQA